MSNYITQVRSDNGEFVFDVMNKAATHTKLRTFATYEGAGTWIERQDAADEKNARLGRQIALAEKLLSEIKELTGMEFSFGYIGNLHSDGTDDRAWYLFAPHPGRVGDFKDSLGGYRTDDLAPLIEQMQAARDMAKWMSQKAERS